MLTARQFWGLAIILVALSGCSTIQIASDHDPSASFADLKTYDWIPEPQKATGDPRIDNPLLERRIRNAVDNQLAAQGYEKRPSGTPDFLVGYHVAIDKGLSITTMNDHYHYVVGPGWRYGAPRGYVSETYVYEYDQGSLILDIVDAGTRKLIWRGSAQAEINHSATSEKREKSINEAVQKMLARFPPKPK